MLGLTLPYRWRVWIHGAIAALINGAASSVAVVIVDPADFNLFQGGAAELGTVALTSAVLGLVTYMKTHPLPDPEKDMDYEAVAAKAVATIQGTGPGTPETGTGNGEPNTAARLIGVFLIGTFVFSAGCTAARIPPGLTAGTPTSAQVQEVRTLAGGVADVASAVLDGAHNAGVLLDSLPLDASTKDRYDCAILRVTGIDSPSATVTKVCGDLPTAQGAPMTIARTKLQSLTTCPSLRATTALVLSSAQPFIDQLETHPSLSLMALALSTSIDFAKRVLEGGPTCAQ
jgi:hypothetical protein